MRSTYFWLSLVVLGIFLFSRLEKESGQQAEVPDYPLRYEKGFAPYAAAVDKDNAKLRSLALRLTDGCSNTECMAASVFSFVQQEVAYKSDPAGFELIQNPHETLAVMGGDCEDLAILLSSLLWNIGIKTDLVATDTHMYSRLCGIDRHALERALEAKHAERLTLIDKRTFLPADSVWSMSFESTYGAENYDIDFSADSKVSLYLFPNKAEFEKMRQGKEFSYYPSCAVKDGTRASLLCRIEPDNVVGIKNTAATVLTIKAARSVMLSAKLTFYEDGGGLCIPLDAAIRGAQVLPAMEMEGLSDKKYIVSLE